MKGVIIGFIVKGFIIVQLGLINSLYMAINGDLGKVFYNLRRRPVTVISLFIPVRYSAKVNRDVF